MLIVCDSSALIALSGIGRLSLLRELFQEIVIPPAVAREVRSVLLPNWIQIAAVNGPFIDEWGLGPGETEALRLATARQIAFIILDDRDAVRIAHRLGLRVIGVLGILQLAKNRQLLSEVRPELNRLVAIGFHISQKLYRTVLQAADEA